MTPAYFRALSFFKLINNSRRKEATMKSRKILCIVVVLFSVALLASCSSKPKSYSGVPMSQEMTPSENVENTIAYRNPNVDIAQYRQVILTPVDIYTGEDASFSGVSPQEQQELASYLYSEAMKTLGEKGLLASQPGPGVARLRLILAGAQKTRPVASGVTHALPVGLAMNLGKGAMGKNGSFMGTATVGGEFTDSQTGNLIASFLTKESPNAMDIPKIFSYWDASKKAMDKVVQNIADRLQQIQVSQR